MALNGLSWQAAKANGNPKLPPPAIGERFSSVSKTVVAKEGLSIESLVSQLRQLPGKQQLTAWSDACSQLMAMGRWKEAVQLAMDSPAVRNSHPLQEIINSLVSTNPQEAVQWMEGEIGGGDLRMRSTLTTLMVTWSRTDPKSSLEKARGMNPAQFSFSSVVMAALSQDPTVLSSEDLSRAIPENEDPKNTISTISAYMSAQDPARAMEWAKTLETAAQRSYAVSQIANSAARENRPGTWELIAQLKTPANRETAASYWGFQAYASDPDHAVQKLTDIQDPTLVAPAAKAMLENAVLSNFSQALNLAREFQDSGLMPDALTQFVKTAQIPLDAWTGGNADKKYQAIGQLPSVERQKLYDIARSLKDSESGQ